MYNISCKTKHLAIRYIDQILQNHTVKRNRIGIIAFMCLFIAAKFEGDCNDYLYEYKRVICLRCKENQIKLESEVLKLLKWNVSQVTSPEILQTLLSVLDAETKETASKFLEQSQKILDFSAIRI